MYSYMSSESMQNLVMAPFLIQEQKFGFQYAGIEYGDECYCDNSIKNDASSVSSGCSMPCSGNSSEYCGGPNRLNLYQLPSAIAPSAGVLPAGWSALGCFTDNVSARILTQGQPVLGGYLNMTIWNCLNACQGAGYSLAGVEYSQECYCGSQIKNDGPCALDQATCNMPCKGNSAETCGGPNRLNMYEYGGSSAVASCVATPTPTSLTTVTTLQTSSTTSIFTTTTTTTTTTSSFSSTSSSQPSPSSAWCPSGLTTSSSITESSTTYALTCGSALSSSPFATTPESTYTGCLDWCNSWGPSCAATVFEDPTSSYQNCRLYSSAPASGSSITITSASSAALFVKATSAPAGPWCPTSLSSGPVTVGGAGFVATCGTGVQQGSWIASSPEGTWQSCLSWCNSWGSYCSAATFQTDTYQNCNLYSGIGVGGTVGKGDMVLFKRG